MQRNFCSEPSGNLSSNGMGFLVFIPGENPIGVIYVPGKSYPPAKPQNEQVIAKITLLC